MRGRDEKCNIVGGKPEQKKPFGGPRCRWRDNIGADLREIWWVGREWMYLAQGRDQWRALVNTVINLQVPQKAGNFY
jgi:hypothetical protein